MTFDYRAYLKNNILLQEEFHKDKWVDLSDKDKEEFELLFQSGDIKALKMLRKISIDFWTSVVLPTAEINLEDRDF
jgi:hypothetical protein